MTLGKVKTAFAMCTLKRLVLGLVYLVVLLLGVSETGTFGDAGAADQQRPQIFTNESYIEEISKKSTLDINDPRSVFQYVLESLPDRVKVFPTENYYYFHFYHNGVRYAGNLRLDVDERRKGVLLFNYFRATTGWAYDEADYRSKLGREQGVTLEKLDTLIYKVSSNGKSVVFELNDLSDVKIPSAALDGSETYIGPVFDESGMQFFLVFNPGLKVFHFILDETGNISDDFDPLEGTKGILLGRRTGFAFYQDQNPDRKILVGVYADNAETNNYFDGPFDQLPDNFLDGEELRQAILTVTPELAGQIDRLGNSPSGESRYLIAPYLHYTQARELISIETCIAQQLESARRICLAMDESALTGGPQ